MSISSVSGPAVSAAVSNAILGQSAKPTSGLGGVTKEIKPPPPGHDGHGPSTQPVDPSTISATSELNTLA